MDNLVASSVSSGMLASFISECVFDLNFCLLPHSFIQLMKFARRVQWSDGRRSAMTGLFVSNLVLSALLAVVNSSPITVIVPHCTEDFCYKLPPNVNVTDLKYYRSLRKLFSGGLTQLVWESISRNETVDSGISLDCASSLHSIWSGIKDGDESSFRMVESSAKTPPAHLDGSISSFGDYDQCLDIAIEQSKHGVDIESQYCIVPLSILGPPVDDVKLFQEQALLHKLDKPRKINLKAINIFKDHTHFHALCLPSACSIADVGSIVAQGMLLDTLI